MEEKGRQKNTANRIVSMSRSVLIAWTLVIIATSGAVGFTAGVSLRQSLPFHPLPSSLYQAQSNASSGVPSQPDNRQSAYKRIENTPLVTPVQDIVSPAPSEWVTNASDPIDQITGWRIHSDAFYNYTLQYPKDWVLEINTGVNNPAKKGYIFLRERNLPTSMLQHSVLYG